MNVIVPASDAPGDSGGADGGGGDGNGDGGGVGGGGDGSGTIGDEARVGGKIFEDAGWSGCCEGNTEGSRPLWWRAAAVRAQICKASGLPMSLHSRKDGQV